MESRVRVLLLRGCLLAAALALQAGCSLMPGGRDAPAAADELPASPPPVIEPEVERREVSEPRIDSEDFEVQAFVGLLNVEDFGSNTVYGARLAYHVSEGVFVEATYGRTGDVDRTRPGSRVAAPASVASSTQPSGRSSASSSNR